MSENVTSYEVWKNSQPHQTENNLQFKMIIDFLKDQRNM